MGTISRRLLLGTATAFAVAPRAARAQTLEKIRLCGVPTDDMTPIYYALKTGLYQRAGIDLEIVTVANGAVSTAGVVGGAYELGKASPTQSVIAHRRSLPVVIIANGAIWTVRTNWSQILVAADSSIKTGADCNGKTGSAANLNDVSQFCVMKWVDMNGGDSRTIKWVEIPGSAAAAAIAEHRVDFALLNEPLLSAALESGKVRILGNGFATVANRFLASAYLAQPDWASKHIELVRAFGRVTYAAAAFTNGHEPETVALMSEVTKIPAAVYAKMARIEGATTSDPSLLQPIIDLALRYKAIDRSFAVRELYF
jgi:NitT/TauT family transport system substrate-binding protein